MKRLSWKIPGIIAVALSLWSFALVISGSVVSIGYEWSGDGVGQPFRLWICSILVAMLSMVFYTIDAILCIKVAIQNEKRLFHVLLAILLLGGIPMVVFVGGYAGLLAGIVWNVYYLAMAVLEVLSVVISWREGIAVDFRSKCQYARNSASCMKEEDPITRHSL